MPDYTRDFDGATPDALARALLKPVKRGTGPGPEQSLRQSDELEKGQPESSVDVADSAYQPTKAELEEDLRVDVSFEDALDALVMPVKIKRVPRPPAVDE